MPEQGKKKKKAKKSQEQLEGAEAVCMALEGRLEERFRAIEGMLAQMTQCVTTMAHSQRQQPQQPQQPQYTKGDDQKKSRKQKAQLPLKGGGGGGGGGGGSGPSSSSSSSSSDSDTGQQARQGARRRRLDRKCRIELKIRPFPSVANLIGWRGNVIAQVGNATRYGNQAVEWLRRSSSMTYEELAMSEEFTMMDRKLAAAFIELAEAILRGPDKTHVSLARSLLQAHEKATQANTLPTGRQLYQIITRYYRVDADKHGGRYTYEDLSCITLKGDNVEKFLQDWDAGLMACGAFEPDPKWVHSHFASEMRKSSRFTVEYQHYMRSRDMGNPDDHSYTWLYAAAWQLIEREREDKNRQAQVSGVARMNEVSGGREEPFIESKADKKKGLQAAKAEKKKTAEKQKTEDARLAMLGKGGGGKGGSGGKGDRACQPCGRVKLPNSVWTWGKEAGACVLHLIGQCPNPTKCKFQHMDAPADIAAQAKSAKAAGKGGGGKGGGGHGKGGNGAAGRAQPSQAMIDLAAKLKEKNGHVPACRWNKEGKCSLGGACPFSHQRRGGTARAQEMPVYAPELEEEFLRGPGGR